uniref:Uncharacterized protein n=1 Tax=Lactuca sativa TaxID=4236 RepID=A0A9R1WQP1_LACSA|nr:hypothetical protein LSAT_V11C100043280 [Lactuca sativa]
MKIVEKLAESKVKFEIRNFQVLKHNTRWDSEGNAYPIFHGLLVEMSNGRVVPGSFDASTRCPDEIIRRIRLGASFGPGPPRLLDTYQTQTDRFLIPPFSWTMQQLRFALVMRHRSDLEILLTTSTSPSAEGPDFVATQKSRSLVPPLWDKIAILFPLSSVSIQCMPNVIELVLYRFPIFDS